VYLTIAVLVTLLVAILTLTYWLLRPRKDVTPGPYHDQLEEATRKTPGNGGDLS